MSDERTRKIADQIAKQTKQMLKNLPPTAKLIRGKEVLSKRDLIKRFEDDDFAADLTGNIAATMLEHAIRKASKK